MQDIKLRPYQKRCVDSVYKEWESQQSTLAVSATGTGKTTIFCEIIKRSLPNRAIILAHRGELIQQAVERLRNQAGIECEVEQAFMRASTNLFSRAPCVVATVQTLYSGEAGKERMFRFKPSDFGILIADEAHHYVSPSYKKVIDYFKLNKDLKVLGVTATPDRCDEEALGQIFESVAFDYEILDAIHEGWLVPVDQQMVFVEGLDFSNTRTTAGDLNGADLAAIMEQEENLQGVASSSVEIVGNRRALAFTSSVKHAEMLCNILNRHRGGMADWVCGATPKDDRKSKLDKFKDGRTQIMVNCGVLTEGFDCPEVEVIIQARPTKSRCLYAQIIGRSLRPLPGIVDGLDSVEERKAAIAASGKKSALIIDFVGNAGRHKLMSSADILGGNVSEAALERAIKKAAQSGRGGEAVRMDELLDKSEEELKREHEEMLAKAEKRRLEDIARKSNVVGKATYKVTGVSPFDVFGIEPERARGWDNGKTLSDKQRAILLKAGIEINGMDYHQQKQLLNHQFARWKDNLCSFKQAKVLMRFGYDVKTMTMKNASEIMDSLAKNGWNRQRADASRGSRVAAAVAKSEVADDIPF